MANKSFFNPKGSFAMGLAGSIGSWEPELMKYAFKDISSFNFPILYAPYTLFNGSFEFRFSIKSFKSFDISENKIPENKIKINKYLFISPPSYEKIILFKMFFKNSKFFLI
jgi:hypothetical protein